MGAWGDYSPRAAHMSPAQVCLEIKHENVMKNGIETVGALRMNEVW